MKILYALAVLLGSISTLDAQVGINSSGTTPHQSAGLDVDFPDRGILIPRMNQSQRDAIQSPAPGLQVYNIDTGCLNLWNGVSWKQSCFDCDFPLPAVGSNSPLCEGTSLYLTASTVPGASYSWAGPNGFTSTDQNPILNNPTVSAGGLYSLVVTVNGCSSSPIGVNVTINAIPAAVAAGSNSPICTGTSLNLTAGNLVAASYTWSGPGGFYSTQQNPSVPDATTMLSGLYEVIASVNGCHSPPSSTSVVVNPSPGTPGVVVGETIFCAGSTGKVYSVSTVAGATSYSWTVPDGAVVASGEGSNSISVNFGSTGGNVCVTAVSSCGTSQPSCTAQITLQGGGGGTQTYVYAGGTEFWTVPTCVTSITLEAWGAEGGTNQTNDRFGGKGARMKGTFAVTPGQQLRIVVGQKGLNGTANQYAAGSGGGATAVSIVGNNVPLIVAGGGGGAGGKQGTYHHGGDGLATTNGGNANPGGTSVGGSGGNGGNGGIGHNHCGAAGGGWYSAGSSTVSESQPGAALSGTAAGGVAGGSYGPNGGFGGGGAANVAGGGGGGYSGGAGGDQLPGWIEYGGGGGGSFNAGTAEDNASGVRSGNGQLTISW